MKQTAVEWLIGQLYAPCRGIPSHIIEQAKEMEKQQMDKVAGDWWNEGASYMHDGRRKYESFEQYYNITFNNEK
jgi:hypothetical protein